MVVVFSTGMVVFVNPISVVDSLPIVAGRSEVVGVCALTKVESVNTPPVKVAIAIILDNTTKLEPFMHF
jgi:hypothetical protein